MRFSKAIMLILVFTGLVGCDTKSPPIKKPILDSSEILIKERIEVMEKIIEPLAKLPSEILDAHYTESKIGDGRLGPSDFFFYASIKVSKGDAKKWSKNLKKPYNGVTKFFSPEIPKEWWLTKEKFMKLRLYETKTYFGRYNGWMAIDDANGLIYVHTFTQ